MISELGLPTWALVLVLVLVVGGRAWTGLVAVARLGRIAVGLARGVPALGRGRRAATRRLLRRRQFASFVESKLRELDTQEEWSDHRFAELEAEVEVEQPGGWERPIKKMLTRGPRLRRERSLSRALRRSGHRLILVQGDPGSGKSVGLRHLARDMASRARKSRSANAVIPLYFNLKKLDRGDHEVGPRLIERFVRESLSEGATSDVDRFLDVELAKGLEEGTWLLLFDSFDEIPELLSSTEVDAAVRGYTSAIDGFLHGMNSCRAVIASRAFRAPSGSSSPVFRILPLAPKRQIRLARKADLDGDQEKLLVGSLPGAGERLSTLAGNPLFLGLLCEYVRTEDVFPANAHGVLETYIERRLSRDEERVSVRFAIGITRLRHLAERVAFAMTAHPQIGLSPTRAALARALRDEVAGDQLDAACDALEYIKLARAEGPASGPERQFSFAHRRFQEYFATCYAIREPGAVDQRRLLLDGRWRETAVTLLQLQPEAARSLLMEADMIMAEISDEVTRAAIAQDARDDTAASTEFVWPESAVHLCALLQEGASDGALALSPTTRRSIDNVLFAASARGEIYDRKWAIDVVGGATAQARTVLLRRAFGSSSDWLKEAAHRQTGRLSELPEDLAREIRRALLRKTARRRLRRDRLSERVEMLRLPAPRPFLSLLSALSMAPLIDALLQGAMAAALATDPGGAAEGSPALAVFLLAGIAHVSFYSLAWTLGSIGPTTAFRRSLRLRWRGERRASTLRGAVPMLPGALPTLPFFTHLMGVYLLVPRLVLPGAAITALVESASTRAALIAVGSVYAATWGPALLMHARVQTGAGPLAWGFPQGLVVWHLVRAVGRISWRVVRDVAIGLAVGGLVVGIGILAQPLLTPTVSDGFALLGSIVVAAVLGLLVINAARDWWWYVRWRRTSGERLDSGAALEALAAQRTPGGVARVIADIRMDRRLDFEPEAVDLVADLTRLTRLAAMLTDEDADPRDPGGWKSSAVASWLDDRFPERVKQLRTVGSGAQDELGRLREDLDRRQPAVTTVA